LQGGGWVTQCTGFKNTLLLQALVEILHWKLLLFSDMKSWIGWETKARFLLEKHV